MRRGRPTPITRSSAYPGLYVANAAAISANVGVNPSLMITAMAERCAARLGASVGAETTA
jgi:cholesterol oxidase